MEGYSPVTPAAPLPDWTEDEAMLHWLIPRLDEEADCERREMQRRRLGPEGEATATNFKAWLSADGPALEAAEKHRDLDPLRAKYPHLARFLQPSRRRRGHPPKNTKFVFKRALCIAGAVEDARRIRAIWKKDYGRKNRRKDQTSAEWFAALIWSNILDQKINEAEVADKATSRRRKQILSP
jgi:hypothetical protein